MSRRTILLLLSAIWVSFALAGCSTALLNTNTLDLAGTVDDIATRQIIHNLVRVEIDKDALPSQVQISGGSVIAKTSITPQITDPLTSVILNSHQVATQVAAATTTTTTNNGQKTRQNASTTVSGVAESSEQWTILPVQDPGQLRRLRLLYQYAAGFISERQLVCNYAIPEKASAIDAAAQGAKPKPIAKPKYVLLRENCFNFYRDFVHRDGKYYPDGRYVRYTQLSENPDLAFLSQPSCVICAVPFGPEELKNADGQLYSRGIYAGDGAAGSAKFDIKNYQYFRVVLNDSLSGLDGGRKCNKPNSRYRQDDVCVNWLFVTRDGVDGEPNGARRVGGANGYSVYVSMIKDKDTRRDGSHKFAEFVLAVIEATLQSTQPTKVGPPAPAIVVTPN